MPRRERLSVGGPAARPARYGALGCLVSLLCAPAAVAAPPAEKPARTTPPPMAEAPTRFISVDEVRPGMTGYGLTVFEGTTPERFDVRVVGVVRRFLPQQDLILIRSDDARLVHSGIVAGMSGSPIYLYDDEGGDQGTPVDARGPARPARLAGALAYGWPFAKDPIAGVTPIAKMVDELRRPLRGREHTPVSEAALEPWYRAPSRPPTLAASDWMDATALRPVAVPLAVSGFLPSAFSELRRALEPYGVEATASGGGGAPPVPEGPDHFEPGGAIAVQLLRGDVSAAGTGTVTYIEGERVAAFGHPMFNVGEIYLPIATARIHTVMASLSSSFKLSSPLREAGTLLQDRQSCIVGDTAQRTDMIPLTLQMRSGGKTVRTFHVDVLRHRFLTPMLATSVLANAVQAAASDVADTTLTVRTQLGVRGYKALDLVDHAFSPDGFSARTLSSLSGMRAIGEILFNPFQPANLERIDVDVDLDYRADVAEIVGLQLGADALEPGSRPSLRVTLRPYDGAEWTEVVPIEIPRTLAGSMVKIEAAAGHLAKVPMAAPERFEQVLDNLRRTYPARSVVVTVQAPEEGLALRGALLDDLPPSVMDTLRPGASTRRGETFKEAARLVVPVSRVLVGKQEIQVKVKEEAAR